LLVACAPAVATKPQPSSAPRALRVWIDPSLEGARISREGAEIIAAKRLDERQQWQDKITDEQAARRIAEHNAADQTKRANRHAWWGVWGPTLVGTSSAVGVALGVVLAWLFAQTFAWR
jgi:hypothetical protein